jgi:hypothetical protein
MTGERKSKTVMRDKQIPDSSQRTVAQRLGGLGPHVASLQASRRKRGPVALRRQLSLGLPLALLQSFIACLSGLRNKLAIAGFSGSAADVCHGRSTEPGPSGSGVKYGRSGEKTCAR